MPPIGKRDNENRLFIAWHEVRGALITAYATVTNGTPTTLDAGDADYFTDIVEIQFSNNSTAAVGVDLKQDGTKVRHYEIPANSTVGKNYPVPLKSITKALPWQITMPDITGTTVEVGAFLIKKTLTG